MRTKPSDTQPVVKYFDRTNALYLQLIRNMQTNFRPDTKDATYSEGVIMGIAIMLYCHAHDGVPPDPAATVIIDKLVDFDGMVNTHTMLVEQGPADDARTRLFKVLIDARRAELREWL